MTALDSECSVPMKSAGWLTAVVALSVLSAGGNALFLQRRDGQSWRQTLRNYANVQYYSDLVIGGQIIAGIFDTGSFSLVVRSTRCWHCEHPTPPYDHKTSRTYKKDGTVMTMTYGSGPATTMMGYEDVSLGPFLAKHLAIWEITEHSIPVLNQAKFAAIVGIGHSTGYDSTEPTLLMSFGIEEFSVCLQKPSGSDGYLTWGSTKTVLPIPTAEAQVIGKHHWGAYLSDVTFIDPVESHLNNIPCQNQGCAVILDSGTSLIAAPGAALAALSQQLTPIAEDCSNLHTLPTLKFKIDGKEFSLPPEAYVMRVNGAVLDADSIWDLLYFKPKIKNVDMCLPAFMEIDMHSQHGPVWILGMPFFRYYHTTFNRVHKTMNFAVAGPDCTPHPYMSHTWMASNATSGSTGLETGPVDVRADAILPPRLRASNGTMVSSGALEI
eukprot:TRINITY_DN18395_c0_g1_i1.p1 TRINITY_DN18395_c0_g1~~TRINITY_DN18395_c0_g1_i1.p1  ORF type:complete len:445 (-),score=69.00 TRINITY_DN18395_c0_g1_i1:42-1355(-)